MKFWPTFFGSFHSPATYVDARMLHRGFAIRYNLQMLLLCGLATVAYILATTTFTMPTLQDAKDIGIIYIGMAILRAAIIAPLMISCCLLGHLFKLQLSYSQGARLAAVAYTPVAVCDIVAFNWAEYAVSPPYLFAMGVAMLLAALYATK